MASYNWLDIITACIAAGGRPDKERSDMTMLKRTGDWLRSSGAPCPGAKQREWIMDIANGCGIDVTPFETQGSPRSKGDTRPTRDDGPPQRQQAAADQGPDTYDGPGFSVKRLPGATDWDVRIGTSIFSRQQMTSREAGVLTRVLSDGITRGWGFIDTDGRTVSTKPLPAAPQPQPKQQHAEPDPFGGVQTDDDLPF